MEVIIYHESGASGQRERLHQAIFEAARKHPACQYLYLVPEQSVLQTEQELLQLHPKHVIGNIQPISFTNLAKEVLAEVEIPTNHILDDIGKSMILRRIAEEKKAELPTFGKNLAKQGFVEEVKRLVNELSASGIRPEQMEQLLAQVSQGRHSLLKRKLEDIYEIYLEFYRQLGTKYTTAEELLWLLTTHLNKSERLKRSYIIVYGFNNFKAYQYQVLEELMKHCRGFAAVLTMQEEDSARYPMALGTCQMLKKMAAENKLGCKEVVLPKKEKNNASQAAELQHLQRWCFVYPTHTYEKEPQALRLIQAENPEEEIWYLQKEILRLIRQEQVSYRDISVIIGDISVYSSLLTTAFERSHIPYFLDQKTGLTENILAQLIDAVLSVLEEDMSYASMMDLVRNPLFCLEQEKADWLDNYLLASGIQGKKRWMEPWEWKYDKMSEDRLLQLNEIRSLLSERLLPLQEVWRGEKQEDIPGKRVRIADGIEALRQFLRENAVEEQMEQWAEHFGKQGDFRRQSEYKQAYEKVMELFLQIEQLMGDDILKPQVIIDILQSGFESMKVGFIPATLDRIVIGDLERSKIGRTKHLFLVGANDKVLPKESESGGILNDYDREILKEMGAELFPTARESVFFHQEYLCLIAAKPKQTLTVTYSEKSREGKEIHPSYLVSMLCRIFPALTAKKAAEQFTGLDALTGEEEGLSVLIEGIRAYLDGDAKDWWKALYLYYSKDEAWKERLELYLDGLFYAHKTEKLDSDIAKHLFQIEEEKNISRLEKYASCAYSHFLMYGLKLKPRKIHELSAADYGTLFHEMIRLFFRQLEVERLDWRTLEAKKRLEIVGNCVKESLKGYVNPIFESSNRNLYMVTRMERMAERTVWALQKQWEEGSYQDTYSEFSFSKSRKTGITLPLQDGLELALQGRIDRIDYGETEQALYVKVIDYKTGNAQFDLNRIYYGLQLQLLLYLDAVLEMEQKRNPQKKVIPGGIYYYNLKDPIVEAFGEETEEIEALQLKALRMNGLTNQSPEAVCMIDPNGLVVKGLERKKDGALKATAMAVSEQGIRQMQKYIRKKAGSLAKAMYDGKIEAAPYEYKGTKSCEYCEYQSICQFDLRTQGCAYRRFEPLKKDDIIESMGKVENEHGSDMDTGTAESH